MYGILFGDNPFFGVNHLAEEKTRAQMVRFESDFHPCVPYANKYANAVTGHGIAQLLVDAEMKMFHGLKTPVIGLQNVVTDLLLGSGFNEALSYFAHHGKTKYNTEPGFIAMNMPKLLDPLEAQGMENPIICANINKLGFRMCPSIQEYEQPIATRSFRPVAMSVMASGAISPREATDYVCKQANIRSIVFGASSRGNILETKRLIDELSFAA